MTEEEKKAIDSLKEYTDSYVYVKNHCENLDKKDYMEKHPKMEAIITILSLVEKQKKEIEELKTITNSYNSYNVDNMNGYNIIIADSEYFANGTFVNNYISKDKIKKFANALIASKYWGNDAYIQGKNEEIEEIGKELLELLEE